MDKTTIASLDNQFIADARPKYPVTGSSEFIVTLDLDGSLLTMTEAYRDVLEMDESETIIGAKWIDFWQDPVSRTEAESAFDAACAGRIGHFIGFCPTQKGTPKWWDVVAAPIQGDDGKLERIIGTIRDITADRYQHQEMRKLASVVENSADLIGIAAPDGSIQYMNRAGCQLLGLSDQEAVRRTQIGEYLFPENMGILGEVRAKGRWVGELQIPHARTSEAIDVSANIFAVYDNGSDEPYAIATVARDIREQKRVQQEREQIRAQQRAFMRDVLYSVTEGKMRLCFTSEELPESLPLSVTPTTLSTANLAMMRNEALNAAEQCHLPNDRMFDLVLAVGEAAMNAVIHSGGGEGRICCDPEAGVVQVWIKDDGEGITLEALPRATLQRGFTTADTMGCGLKIILESVDCIYLLTGQTGTTMVLEQHRTAPESVWLP